MNCRSHVFAIVITICLLLSQFPATVFASVQEDPVASGFCGGEGERKNLTWELDSAGTLTINGSGAMEDFESDKDVPWYQYRNKIESLKINSGVTTIGDWAFSYCKCCRGTLSIPEGVFSIGTGAFYYCAGLTGELVIPESVIAIKANAFYCCEGFQGTVSVPSGVKNIGSSPFGACTGITGFLALNNSFYCTDEGILFNTAKTELIQCPGGKTGSVTIPGGVEIIGESAFEYCRITESLSIPDSVTTIGMNAFWGCRELSGTVSISKNLLEVGTGAFGCCNEITNITVDANNPNYASAEGILYNKDKTTLLQCPAGNFGNITIPDGVETIGDYAFEDCQELFGMDTIPDSVKTIGRGAFVNAWFDDEKLLIGSGVEKIGASAFRYSSVKFFFFSGDAPDVDESFDKKSIVYFVPNKKGWSLPTWNGNETATWNSSFMETEMESGFCGGEGDGDNLSWKLDSARTLVISGTGPMADYEEGTAPWNAIERLVIADGVTSIGDYAFNESLVFRNYSSNQEPLDLVIPDSVTSIGDYAFCNSVGLDGSLILSSQLSAIGDHAFDSCSFTGSLELPESVKTIGAGAFSYCGFTGSLELPDGVERIGKHAFEEVYGVEGTVSIGKELIEIGAGAFKGCAGITGFSVDSENPNYITDDGVIYNKNKTAVLHYPSGKTQNMTIFDGITEIGEEAFAGLSGYSGSISIPESVVKIGDNAFVESYDITGTISIPKGVSSIGAGAFRACESLTDITVDPANEYYSAEDGILYNKNKTTIVQCLSGNTGEVVIPAGVTHIADEAYADCRFLTGSLLIPDSVVSIGVEAFNYCGGIQALQIGKGVLNIGDFAFADCMNLMGDLVIPDTVISLGEGVFWGCERFNGKIQIGNGITAIPKYAFRACKHFSGDLTIGNNVKSIGESAFRECSGFDGMLTIGNGVTEIDNRAFYECGGFTGLSLGSQLKSIGIKAFYGCEEMTGTLAFPESLKKIGNCAFESCIGFTGDLVIPDSVTTLGEGAFSCCRGFDGQLTLSEGVSIVNDSFFGCSKLSGNLVIPESVTVIGDFAFYGCSSLSGELIIPESVRHIGEAAFYECRGFSGQLIIPDQVLTIGDSAFYQCTGFDTSAVIGRSVLEIGAEACINFDKVYLKGNAPILYGEPFKEKVWLFAVEGKYGWRFPRWNGYLLLPWSYGSNSPTAPSDPNAVIVNTISKATFEGNVQYDIKGTMPEIKKDVVLTFALYDRNGKMLSVSTKTLPLSEENSIFSGMLPESKNAGYIKIFTMETASQKPVNQCNILSVKSLTVEPQSGEVISGK